jgi:hypothetical protein
LMVRGKLNVWNTITMIAMFCVRRMAIIWALVLREECMVNGLI